MPNWCKTKYVFYGNEDQLNGLYNALCICGAATDRLSGIVTHFGFDPDDPHFVCRGTFDGLKRTRPDRMVFETLTAWNPLPEMWSHILEKNFPDVSFAYYSEETGNELYERFDPNGVYKGEISPADWILFDEDNGRLELTTRELLDHIQKEAGYSIAPTEDAGSVFRIVVEYLSGGHMRYMSVHRIEDTDVYW